MKKLFWAVHSCVFVFSISIPVNALKKEAEYKREVRVDNYLQNEFEKTHIPGMSIVIVNKEEVLFSNTYGQCENIDKPFIIGSMSKSFTALAIMQLVEQGSVSLDDSVSKYLPDFDGNKRITIRHLLNQTSGISTYQTRKQINTLDNYGIHEYANLNYGLLGEIIETVSGKSYGEFVEQNIYEPLGMIHSYTSLQEGKNNGLIDGYRNYFGIPIAQEIPYPSGEDYWSSIAAGYLISSVSDMGKYLQMYLNNGGNVVSSDSIHTVWYDNVYDEPSETYYGMGWGYTDSFSEPMFSHSGLVENYSSFMFILPKSDIGVVMLVNMNDYFVTNQLMGAVGVGVIHLLTDGNATMLSKLSYTFSHLLINAIYIVILSVSILPLCLFKRWHRKVKEQSLGKILLSGSLAHVIYPTFLLLFPGMIGIPFAVIHSFVPDLFIVLIVSVVLAYSVGLVKGTIIYKKKSKRQ